MNMKDYNLEIVNARFVASAWLVRGKSLLYRLRPEGGNRGGMRQEDYKLGTLPAEKVGGSSAEAGTELKLTDTDRKDPEYWLGRSALTDVVVKVPEMGTLVLNDVTVNVSLQKEIVKTQLVGHKGTIKEYISDGDYQLTMSVGVVAMTDSRELLDQYPEQAMATLRKVLERPEALEVSSAFLDVFQVNRIVVTGFSAKQMTYANRQLVEITALSDDDYVIKSTEY
nr:MAG TPA: hypothetical protein [Caudoviricetes sp.]